MFYGIIYESSEDFHDVLQITVRICSRTPDYRWGWIPALTRVLDMKIRYISIMESGHAKHPLGEYIYIRVGYS